MALWDEIINRPASIADAYATLWKAQAGREVGVEQILAAHPRLTEDAIHAALAFAAEALRVDVLYPVAEAVA